MDNRQRRFTLALVALLFLASSLACSAGRFLPEQRVETPTREVAVSQEAAQEAQEIVAEAAAGGPLRMNEAQFTSLIAAQLAQSGQESPLQEITVWFDPGVVVIQGQLQEGVVPLVSGQLVMSGQLAVENDNVIFNIQEASVAGVNLPGAGVNLLNDQINRSLSQTNLGSRVRSITINEGEIVIEQE